MAEGKGFSVARKPLFKLPGNRHHRSMQLRSLTAQALLVGVFVSMNACGSGNSGADTSSSGSSSGGTGGEMGTSSSSSSGSSGGNGGAGGGASSSSSSSSSSGVAGGSAADTCAADGSDNAYYLAPDGSDSAAGTNAAPWKTFSFALKALKAGDTLCAHGGTYKERAQVGVVTPGAANAPVRVLSVAGEKPVIQGLLWVKGADYWQFHGINATWDVGNSHDEHMVKFTDGQNWEFADAEVWGAESFAGILVAGVPSAWALRRLYVHDTADIGVTGHSVNQDHLIYVNAGIGGGVIERSILIGSPNGRAVKIGPSSCGNGPSVNVVVRYNTMVDNLGPSNVQFSCESHDNLAEWNLMVRPQSGRANVTGFSLTGANNVAKNNLGWESSEVVEMGSGVVDGGGNIMRDPLFVNEAMRDFHVNDAMAKQYGAYAP